MNNRKTRHGGRKTRHGGIAPNIAGFRHGGRKRTCRRGGYRTRLYQEVYLTGSPQMTF